MILWIIYSKIEAVKIKLQQINHKDGEIYVNQYHELMYWMCMLMIGIIVLLDSFCTFINHLSIEKYTFYQLAY